MSVDVKVRMGKIKSTGYWRVNIRPTKFEKTRIDSPDHCWKLVELCRVYLRGWDYPHMEEKTIGEDWVQSGVDLDTFGHVELWRFYQSGQFIHYFSCLEDYREKEVNTLIKGSRAGRLLQKGALDQGRYSGLSVLSTLYRVTEIFEFAARLAQREVLQPSLEISIKLVGMENRTLFFWDPGRQLLDAYFPQINEILFEKKLSIGESIAESHANALDATIYIFGKFRWLSPSRQILAEDQRKFLERRL
jgi:hypothetical protein